MIVDYAAARAALLRALAERGWNAADLAREARVDPGTVLDFLNGERAPQVKSRGKIEKAIGWPAGTLHDIASGAEPPQLASAGTPLEGSGEVQQPALRVVESENPVLAAIERDPYLLPEAKEHFRNQYLLLLRVTTVDEQPERLPYAAHGRRVGPVDPEQEKRIEDAAKRAKQANPDSPGAPE